MNAPEPALSDAEWDLVLDLLLREQRELPAEIHHTRKQELHEQLRQRLKVVSSLVLRLRRERVEA